MRSDITGTTQNSFSIGRLDLPKLIFIKNPALIADLNITWPANAGISGQYLQGDGAGNLSWASAYGTVLPGGSNLSGTYAGDVIVQGNASLNGATVIQGDLYIIGNLTYSSGTSLTISGDLIVTGSTFDLRNLAGNNPSFTCNGDVITSNAVIEFRNYASQRPFRVGGSLYCQGFRGEGMVSGARGQNLEVKGDMIFTNIGVVGSYPNQGPLVLYGQNENGGQLKIHGALKNFIVTTDGGLNALGNGFIGGSVLLGSFEGYSISTQGGAGDSGGGIGGNINIQGDCICYDSLATRGGPAITSGNSAPSGFIDIFGNLAVKSIETESYNNPNGGSGDAGGVKVRGDLIFTPTIGGGVGFVRMKGGNAVNGNGGNGGSLTVLGDMKGSISEMTLSGGNSSGGFASGNGGDLDVIGQTILAGTNIFSLGGQGSGGSSHGNGGTFEFNGYVAANVLHTHSTQGLAGDITIKNGCNLNEIRIGTSSALDTTAIKLAGNCNIKTIFRNTTALHTVENYNTQPAILQIGDIGGNDILTATGGNLTLTNTNNYIIWYDTVNNIWLFNSRSCSTIYERNFTFADIGSTLVLFSLPANARVLATTIYVTTAFDGVSPQARVGGGAVNNKYMTIAENLLTAIGVYEAKKALVPNPLVETISMRLLGSGSTVGNAYVNIVYGVPHS